MSLADAVIRSKMTLGEMLHIQALRDPAAAALVCGEEEISYGELDESSSRLAGWLLEQGLASKSMLAEVVQ